MYICTVPCEPTTIPFRRSNRLSYKAMSSSFNERQLYTATPISSFVQCSDFILAITFVSHYIYLNRNLTKNQ